MTTCSRVAKHPRVSSYTFVKVSNLLSREFASRAAVDLGVDVIGPEVCRADRSSDATFWPTDIVLANVRGAVANHA